MKKLTPRYKRWLKNRSRNEFRQLRGRISRMERKSIRTIVTAWDGDSVNNLICTGKITKPPSVICFETNGDETLRFFGFLRNHFRAKKLNSIKKPLAWIKPSRSVGKLGKISGYADYSAITEMSTAAALVTAAEYDRARLLIGSVPPTINLHEWNIHLFNKLFELGFFQIVGLTQNVGDRYREEGDVRTMRILKGINASDIQLASEMLIELSKFIDDDGPLTEEVIIALNSALSEAMANVSRHAYPKDLEFEYAHVNAWWITASADRKSRELTVVIFDQGASIPVTLPRNPLFTGLVSLVNRVLSRPSFEYQHDAYYIEGALERGRTQTRERGRGYGLPQMKDLVDICGAGSLTIRSRGGVCRYRPGDELTLQTHVSSIGGTLIEWVMELPRR